ncbi:FAD-dependent oxidoreductase [Leptothrix discophora]|uniref:FAD-dependent oxidoreductase n=1 Tax=Leptothrix discophora TaxID=89 RepID=A0ABT9G2F2_LEPDI|nr:bifunctional TVP38/TMEM64 family protein/FAD-dependent oxidoreductase [Leptothrix discophora]MDP4300669.1 FAD-dependent oxidoreductase [Leptothrix discophora]
MLALLTLPLLPGEQLPTLATLQAAQAQLQAWQASRPLATAGLYLLVYVGVAALSLPGAALLTLAGGALFGLGWGLLLVSFASTIGATLAFLASRWLLRDRVQSRWGDRLATVNAGVARDGAFYLFTLRLVPALPFFVVNLLMGLTPMRTWTYAWVSQLGMLPATAAYVNAGTELARLRSLADVVSPGLLGAFVLLGLFPLLARAMLARLRQGWRDHLALRRWPRPRRFDRNLIVIGGGSAGLVTAYIAAAVKARVTLVERDRLGGDCLNTGCVPSKALIRAARAAHEVRRAAAYGVQASVPEVDFAAVIARVRRVIAAIEPHDSVERYTGLGVDIALGHARIVSPWAVEITGHDGSVRTLTSRAIVIAAGARPTLPDIPGLADAPWVTSDTVWSLRQRPARLLVLGGGPIGCELAQAYARLGSRVTLVEQAPRLLLREDAEVGAFLAAAFARDGIEVRTGTRALAFGRDADGGHHLRVQAEAAGAEPVEIGFDTVLVAVGRSARLSGYGLEELGIATGRTVEVDGYLRTAIPTIHAAGDVAGPWQFTHAAAHQAWYAAVNALFAPFKRFAVDTRLMPAVTYTDPEIARVGLNAAEASAQGIAVERTRFELAELDRALIDGEAGDGEAGDGTNPGWVEVLTVPGKDRILGVTIVGAHAGELLAEWVLAMKHGIGLNGVLGTIHVYPTLAESARHAAGAWKRAHAPQALLAWVGRFHAWRREGWRA